LVVWGRNDEILDPSYADKFMDVLPNAHMVWIDECGHVPALEQPDALVSAIDSFVNESS
jgi:pimeloyl-ACP methyl ester carboxylesterase